MIASCCMRAKTALACLAALLGTSWGSASADSLLCGDGVQGVIGGWQTNNKVWAVDVVGDMVYVADGIDGLRILDMSDPAAPVMLGDLDLPTSSRAIEVVGTRAYVIDVYLGLQILDVSNPMSPVLLGALDTDAVIHGLAVVGDTVLLANEELGLLVVDVSDPADPAVIHSLALGGDCRAVVVDGDIACALFNLEGMKVLDMSNPAVPVEIGAIGSGSTWSCVEVRGGVAAVSVGEEITIIDLSHPAAPVVSGTLQVPQAPVDLEMVDSFLFVAAQTSGVIVIDIADPGAPGIFDSIPTSESATGVCVTDSAVYIAEGMDGLQVFGRAALDGWPVVSWSTTWINAPYTAMHVKGTLVYLAQWWESDLVIVDISNELAPETIGTLSTWKPRDVFVVGTTAYIADDSRGLRTVEVSDPTAPVLLDSLSVGTMTAYGVWSDGLHAYLASSAGLHIFDVSDPADLAVVASYPTSSATEVLVVGATAYVAARLPELTILDISDPRSPVFLGSYDSPGNESTAVAVRGDIAFLGYPDGGIHVLDISDTSAPQLVHTIGSAGSVYELEIAGDLLYAVSGDMVVYDVTEPTAPVLVDHFRLLRGTHEVQVMGDRAFVCGTGLVILDVSPCAPCPADLNNDGLLDFFDLQAFLNLYSAGDPAADLIDDGIIDFFDVQEFLNLFAAGCA